MYLSDYNMKVIILGMGVSLIATLISMMIIGQKLYLYYLNTQNAKDSMSGESDEYAVVCKSPISVNERVIKDANSHKLPTTRTVIVEDDPIQINLQNTKIKPSLHQRNSQLEINQRQKRNSQYENTLRHDRSNGSECIITPSESNSYCIKRNSHITIQNGGAKRQSYVSGGSLVSSKYMLKGERSDASKSTLSKSKGFEGREEDRIIARSTKNSQNLYNSPSDSTTLPPIKGIFTPASLDYKSDTSNKSSKSGGNDSCLSNGTLKVATSNTVVVHEKTLIVAKSNEVVSIVKTDSK